MRILFVGLFLASLVSIGMFASGFGSGAGGDEASAASAAFEPAAATRPATAKPSAPSDTVTAAIETVRSWLPGGSSADASSPASRGGRVYFQWTDAGGSVHIVQSLEEVPAEWRGRAGRIEMQERPKRKRVAGRTPSWTRTQAPAATARNKEVVVYTATWCGWCRKTLAWLDERGIDYENRDIDANPANRDELIRKAGRASIPVVEIDGRLVRGFDPSGMQALLGS